MQLIFFTVTQHSLLNRYTLLLKGVLRAKQMSFAIIDSEGYEVNLTYAKIWWFRAMIRADFQVQVSPASMS